MRAATPRRPTPRCCSTAWIFPSLFTIGRWANCRAARKCACCWRRLCSARPAVLLLDEPTNNLDLDSVHWLQDYLIRFEGCLIVISHDRHFLNEVCTHIADIDYQTIITYTGGYDDMVLAKTQIRSRIESENAQREKKIEQLNEFIRTVRGRNAIVAGHVAKKGSRALADLGPRAFEHRAPLHSLRN